MAAEKEKEKDGVAMEAPSDVSSIRTAICSTRYMRMYSRYLERHTYLGHKPSLAEAKNAPSCVTTGSHGCLGLKS